MSYKLLDKLYDRERGRCYYCNVRCDNSRHRIISHGRLVRNAATIDHVITQASGGATDMENCVLACHACNNERGSSDAAWFKARKGRIT